jgi:hypothetical protein
MSQDVCFSDIFGAPTAVDIDVDEKTMARRLRNMSRKVSVTVHAITAPAAKRKKKDGVRSRVRKIFFDNTEVRSIPIDVEANRALVGLSIAHSPTAVGSSRSSRLNHSGNFFDTLESGSMRGFSGDVVVPFVYTSSSNVSSTSHKQSTRHISSGLANKRSQILPMSSRELSNECRRAVDNTPSPVETMQSLEIAMRNYINSLSNEQALLAVKLWGYGNTPVMNT